MSCFITLEGIEGSGKSTLQKHLEAYFLERQKPVICTREPGATRLGQAIRELLLDRNNTELSPIAELALFAADRAQHLAEVVRPALAAGKVVLCDRYFHSTIAYQGFGRGLPLAQLNTLIEIATGGLKPDIVFLLDLEPETGLTRVRKRSSGDSTSWSRFEDQELAFHRKVRAGFLELARDPENKFVVLDANQSPESIAAAAIKQIESLTSR